MRRAQGRRRHGRGHRGRGADAGTRCTRSSNMDSGKSNSSTWASWGIASTTGPQSAGSVSTRATWGSVREQLVGPGDPVEVARDRAEGVVDRGRGVAEVLDLLEHGIGSAARERVAGQQQHREPVGVRHSGGGDHVEGAWADGGGHGHHLAAVGRPGEADRGEGHALLVLAAPGRQLVALLVQGGAQPEDVAVPEDREHAREQRHLAAVEQLRALRDHPADERLGGGQSDRAGHRASSESSGGAIVVRRNQAVHPSRTPR